MKEEGDETLTKVRGGNGRVEPAYGGMAKLWRWSARGERGRRTGACQGAAACSKAAGSGCRGWWLARGWMACHKGGSPGACGCADARTGKDAREGEMGSGLLVVCRAVRRRKERDEEKDYERIRDLILIDRI